MSFLKSCRLFFPKTPKEEFFKSEIFMTSIKLSRHEFFLKNFPLDLQNAFWQQWRDISAENLIFFVSSPLGFSNSTFDRKRNFPQKVPPICRSSYDKFAEKLCQCPEKNSNSSEVFFAKKWMFPKFLFWTQRTILATMSENFCQKIPKISLKIWNIS